MQYLTEQSEISILAVLDEHNGKEGKKICDKAAKDAQKLRYSPPRKGYIGLLIGRGCALKILTGIAFFASR